eukprot:4839687-Alexandrium_andersonii.AAC.1
MPSALVSVLESSLTRGKRRSPGWLQARASCPTVGNGPHRRDPRNPLGCAGCRGLARRIPWGRGPVLARPPRPERGQARGCRDANPTALPGGRSCVSGPRLLPRRHGEARR